MAYEKRLPLVAPQPFTANSVIKGQVKVLNASLFKVKQIVIITANTLPNLDGIEIKRIDDINTMYVGPIGGAITDRTDISAYTVALSAAIFADEQNRPNIPEQQVLKAVYEEEPTVALRAFLVDEMGDEYNTLNPLPVNAIVTVTIPPVTATVNLDAFTKLPADNSIAVGTEDSTLTGIKHALRVDPQLDLRVGISDGANKAIVNADGSLDVRITNPSGTGGPTIEVYNAITAVASGVTTTIASYTVPVGKTSILERISCSGDNYARFTVQINAVEVDAKRNWYADWNADFDYMSSGTGYTLNAGDTVRVRVLHSRPFVGNFNARIQLVNSI